MSQPTNHSQNYLSKTNPGSQILHRSNSFPLMKRNSPMHSRFQMYDARISEPNSCVLFQDKKSFLRLENARCEYFLARGVKYNKDADPARKKIALIMLLRAAINGSSHALEELYDCYRRGIGTPPSEKVAVQLLKAFLQQSVEVGFLENLLTKASTCNENLSRYEFLNPSSMYGSAYKTEANSERTPWLCLPLRAKRGYIRTNRKPSQRFFCFISD